MSDPRSIRPMKEDDIAPICEMLGRAFYEGGELAYSFPGATATNLAKFFECTVRGYYYYNNNNSGDSSTRQQQQHKQQQQQRHQIRMDVTHDLKAFALWIPPGGAPLPATATIKLMYNIFQMLGMLNILQPSKCWHGWSTLFPKNGTFQEVSQGMHPTDPPHWYLLLLGADPTVQGKGYGSAMLQYGLENHVAKDDPAYLDCGYSKTAFYQRKGGFEIIDVVPVNGDANEFPENF